MNDIADSQPQITSSSRRVVPETQTQNDLNSQLPLMDARDFDSQSQATQQQIVNSQLSQSRRKSKESIPVVPANGSKPKEVEDDDDLELEFQHFDDQVFWTLILCLFQSMDDTAHLML